MELDPIQPAYAQYTRSRYSHMITNQYQLLFTHLEGFIPFFTPLIAPSQSLNHMSAATNNIYDFTREKDFQSLLPALTAFDVNDPNNLNILIAKAKQAYYQLSALFDKKFQLVAADFHFSFHHRANNNNNLVTTSNRSQGASNSNNNNNNGNKFTCFFNFAKFKSNMRLRLLSLRVSHSYLFPTSTRFQSHAIPLLEKQLRQHELFKGILMKADLLLYPTVTSPSAGDDEYDDGDTDLVGNNNNNSNHNNNNHNNNHNRKSTTALPGQQSKNIKKMHNFLQRVRQSQTVLTRKSMKKRLLTSSIVLETNYFPGIMKTVSQLEAWLNYRKRVLKPTPLHRSHIRNGYEIDHCDVLIQIVGARNIPMRIPHNNFNIGKNNAFQSQFIVDESRGGSKLTSASASSSSSSSSTGKRVRSFIEVSFQEHTIATMAIEGSMPLWRQVLSLPFHPPHGDFSPLALEQIRDDLVFILFDEIWFDDSAKGGFLEGENTWRNEKYYLGHYTIPFLTVYQQGNNNNHSHNSHNQGKIEGLFRMETPLINIGYERPKHRVFGGKNSLSTNTNFQDQERERESAPLLNNNAENNTSNPPLSGVNFLQLFSYCAACFSCCCIIVLDCCPFLTPAVSWLQERVTQFLSPLFAATQSETAIIHLPNYDFAQHTQVK
jgi:hypothetical protein